MPDLRRGWRFVGGTLVCALLLGATSMLSHCPAGRVASGSELRLAMRSALARVEICRDRTADELAALAAHLRSPRICDQTAVNYRLVVVVDGEARLDQSVRHRGVRHTRPLAIDLAIPVEPGARSVDVRFEPEVAIVDRQLERASEGMEQHRPLAGRGDGEASEFDLQFAKLPRLRLTATMLFEAGRARLVRIGEDGELEIAPDPARPSPSDSAARIGQGREEPE